jgi:hypothetical protein
MKAFSRCGALLRRSGLGLLPLALAMIPRSAGAAAPGDTDSSTWVNYEPPATERRGGFTVGASVGVGLGDFTGYPLVASQVGDPDFKASTGTTFGTSGALWLGGTPRDWLTAGLGFAYSGAFGGDGQGMVMAPFFRVEAYPLYALGGNYRDLGVGFDGGAGFGGITAADGGATLAEGGSMAFVSFAAFYEPFRFGSFSSGPALSLSHAFSQTLTATTLTIGWRLSLFSKRPAQRP